MGYLPNALNTDLYTPFTEVNTIEISFKTSIFFSVKL